MSDRYHAASGCSAEDLLSYFQIHSVQKKPVISIHSITFMIFARMNVLRMSFWKAAESTSRLRSTMKPVIIQQWYHKTSFMIIL